jgi:hypothetical protein
MVKQKIKKSKEQKIANSIKLAFGNKNTQNLKDMSKEFLLEFFKNCNLIEDNGVVNVSNVPLDFEEFIGKKAPYKFVFDIKTHDKVKDSELIMQGSYFLVAIKDYLSNKGQASLLKINVDEVNDLNLKKTISKPGVIYEFSFLSTYQFLNEKKQSISKILIKDEKVFDVNLSDVKIKNGDKEDIKELDLEKEYIVAKNVLDKNVKSEIMSIKKVLKEKLEKELLRIKDHYVKQIKEKDDEVETCVNKIKMLQGKLRHTSYERDIINLRRMIRESQERLEMLKKKSYKERLQAEEKFHINDEIEKHVLSIKNDLINVSVWYW